MKRLLLILVMLLPAVAQGQGVLIVGRPSVDVVKISQLVDGGESPIPYDENNAASYSEATALDNARIIQDAGLVKLKAGIGLEVDGMYIVTDHDDDGYGILWSDIQCGQLHGAGRMDEMTEDYNHYGEVSGFTYRQEAADDSYDEYCLCLQDFWGWDVSGLVIRGAFADSVGDAITPGTTEYFWAEGHMAGGLRLRNDNQGTPNPGKPSGKSTFAVSVVLCNYGVYVGDNGSSNQGPDNLLWTWFDYRRCNQAYVCNSVQALDHVFLVAHCSGDGSGGFRFMEGGNVQWVYAYGTSNTWLTVDSTVDTAAGNFRVDNLRIDNNVGLTSSSKICDVATSNNGRSIRIKGSSSEFLEHKMIHADRTVDVQVDWAIPGWHEGLGYPMRPSPRQWVERYYPPSSAVVSGETLLMFVADRDRATPSSASDDCYNLAATEVNVTTGAITAIGDHSASGNVLVPGGGTSPIVSYGSVMARDAAYFTNDVLVDLTPVGVIDTAVSDLVVDFTVTPTTPNEATNYIVTCTDTNGANGWRVFMDQTYHISFRCGSDTVLSTDALAPNRPNRVRCIRNRSAGSIKICINEALADGEETLSLGTGEVAIATGDLSIGQQQTGGSAWSNGFEGYISAMAVDNTIYTDDDPETGDANQIARDKFMRQFGGF